VRPVQSAHAILLVDGRYALQLRDDKPDVIGAGLWGLFGGAVLDGETPSDALRRELYEELVLRVTEPRLLWTVDGVSERSGEPKRWWFFEVRPSDPWDVHQLHEGQAARLFAFEETARLPMADLTRSVLSRHRAACRR
jgi:8-oxo-dGTP diphosphatase